MSASIIEQRWLEESENMCVLFLLFNSLRPKSLHQLHVIIYGCATGFLAIAAFVSPGEDSPFQDSFASLSRYFVSIIGASVPAWGLLWYWGLLVYERVTETRLEVNREKLYVRDLECKGEYVQLGEIVDHWWPITSKDGLTDDFAQPKNGSAAAGVRRADDNDGFEFENGRERREVRQHEVPSSDGFI